MNKEEQRALIAKACGWKVFPYVVINGSRVELPSWFDPRRSELFTPDDPGPGFFIGSRPPDYPGDLNAMHEAEGGLSDDQWIDYIDHLKIILNAHAGSYRSVKAKINATAAQKAEAFLKALNLWK